LFNTFFDAIDLIMYIARGLNPLGPTTQTTKTLVSYPIRIPADDFLGTIRVCRIQNHECNYLSVYIKSSLEFYGESATTNLYTFDITRSNGRGGFESIDRFGQKS
jgi:hypothetical protein